MSCDTMKLSVVDYTYTHNNYIHFWTNTLQELYELPPATGYIVPL